MKPFSEKNMTVAGHLKELRRRLILCMFCLLAAFFAGLSFAPYIIEHLTDLGKDYGYTYIFIAPQELLMQHFSVAFLAALCVMFPLILYQLWAFLRPGLKKNENLLFVVSLIFGLLCFIAGILFAYEIMVPFILYFLIHLSEGSEIAAAISVQSYLTFLFTLFLLFGLIFELPVLSVILTQLGLLKISWMQKGRRVVVVIIFFLAALITPPDVVSQIMVAVPVLCLYEISILLCLGLLKLRNYFEKKRE